MKCCTTTCQKWTTFSVAGLFILLGVLLAVLWKDLFQKIANYELSLVNRKTKGYDNWIETPIPMYLQFYLFNWTNPEDVTNSAIKPNFEEHGPYTYYEHHIRENVTFNDNGTITFQTKRLWRFLPEKSVGSLSDEITTLNPIVVTIGNLVKYKHHLVKRGVNFFLKEKRVRLAVTKNVSQFLFDGYEDPMLDLVHKLNITGFNVPYTKFGWFVERNGSAEYDGVFNMYNGGNDINKLGLLTTWNYNDTVSFFKGDCGKVDGTIGELWYPPRDRSSIKLFASDLCSSVELIRKAEYTTYGIEGHKYVGSDKVFDNGTSYKEMQCFLTDGVQLLSGVRNVSACKFGAPAFVSYPHFYLADPGYREAVSGMHPDQTKHEMYIALEPSTGLPLRVQASFQINLKMDPVDGIDILTNITSTMMPSFWFKQTADLSEDLAAQAKVLLVAPVVGTNTGYGFIGIGALLIVVGVFITYRRGWKQSEEEELLNGRQSSKVNNK
ncbi:hypothetical protein NQ315_007808 [Exocentrus adspersus]|uniref:Protein croquemort n=1 Tax=Exocentrus adspersus TaxID=1586481 RepID=A0AAV8W8Z7_9CUCU|nr:hypothetical protein NQ315_007808 [Exocentrus adspersus]